jgi:hypothetical protein
MRTRPLGIEMASLTPSLSAFFSPLFRAYVRNAPTRYSQLWTLGCLSWLENLHLAPACHDGTLMSGSWGGVRRVGRTTLSRTMDMTVPVVVLPRVVRASALMHPRTPAYQKKLAKGMPRSAVMAVVLSPLARPLGQTGPAYVSRDCHRQGHDCMALSPSRGRPALEGDSSATTAERDGFQVVRAIPDSRLAGATAHRGVRPMATSSPCR